LLLIIFLNRHFEFNNYKILSTKHNEGDLNGFAASLLHGKGYDRWFDKSFNVIVSKNGRIGLNVEHSWADAPVNSFMWEHTLADDIKIK